MRTINGMTFRAPPCIINYTRAAFYLKRFGYLLFHTII